MSRLLSLLLAVAALAACSNRIETPLSPTTTPVGTATPAGVSASVSGERAFEHVQALASVIGPRVVGTAGRDAAADYLFAQWTGLGYRVERQGFVARFSEDHSTLTASATEAPLRVFALNQSKRGSAEARLVDVGLGEPSQLPAAGLASRIALIERGTLTFQTKVENVARAGASGAIIFNDSPGPFGGNLREESTIPAVSLSREDGLLLREAVGRGGVVARLAVEIVTAEQPAVNLIARPSDEPCSWLIGGHYDTVAGAPGASDNGSGIAVALEIARALAPRASALGVCFVAFDAEEEGLLGSAHFVRALSAASRSALRAYVNLDTVGVGVEWEAIGTPALAASLQTAGRVLGISVGRRDLPANAGSDHASFIQGGLPAVFLYRADDDLIHTPQDQAPRVPPATLEEAARLVVAFVERSSAA